MSYGVSQESDRFFPGSEYIAGTANTPLELNPQQDLGRPGNTGYIIPDNGTVDVVFDNNAPEVATLLQGDELKLEGANFEVATITTSGTAVQVRYYVK